MRRNFHGGHGLLWLRFSFWTFVARYFLISDSHLSRSVHDLRGICGLLCLFAIILLTLSSTNDRQQTLNEELFEVSIAEAVGELRDHIADSRVKIHVAVLI